MGVTQNRIRKNTNTLAPVIADLDHKAVQSDKTPPSARRGRAITDPTVCQRCGSVYTKKMWRRPARLSHALLGRAEWAACPACEQVASGEYFGRVLIEGSFVRPNQEAIRARIENVAARAEYTQPQRRVIEVNPHRSGLEVLTTSQKLAHRIAHELKKAFQGRVSYAWADRDGALFARWHRDAAPAPRRQPA